MIEPHIHSVHNFPLHTTHTLTLPPNPEHHLGPTVNMFLHNFSGLQRHYVWLHQLQRHRNAGEDVRWCEHRHCQLGGRGGGHGDGDSRGVPAVKPNRKEREVTTTKDPTKMTLTLTTGSQGGTDNAQQTTSLAHAHTRTQHVHTHTHTQLHHTFIRPHRTAV